MTLNRPKIGIALSGSAGRGIAHVGILEVLQEHNIPIDIVVGCSSGALIAIAYGAGTLELIKQTFLNFSWGWLWKVTSFWGSKGGLLNFNNGEAEMRALSRGLKFEQLKVRVGISAADIKSGELVTITSGDIIPALKATVALPGLFAPVIIDGRLLVDGGLINVVPTIPTKQMGADIVIGVDLARTKFLYQRKLWFWKIIRTWRRLIGIEYVQHQIINPITSRINTEIENLSKVKKQQKIPNMFRIFFWGVDHSFDVEQELDEEQRACDLMIEPPVKESSGKWGVKNMEGVYEEGRKAALEAVPKIKALIAEFEKRQNHGA